MIWADTSTMSFNFCVFGIAPNNGMSRYPFPANAVPCSTNSGVNFMAPPGFSVSNISANGQANGLMGAGAAVGQGGYYDSQRYVTGPGTFNFYTGTHPWPISQWGPTNTEWDYPLGSVVCSRTLSQRCFPQTGPLLSRHSSEMWASLWLLERRHTHVNRIRRSPEPFF
jgi:hypothetical protein